MIHYIRISEEIQGVRRSVQKKVTSLRRTGENVASRAFVTRKRFSACWGNSPIPIERCLRHRAAHPFRMLQRQFLPKKKARCSMSITPTLHRTFHHLLFSLFSSYCRTSCSCSCSFFCSFSFRISCTIFCATSQSCISDFVLRYSA